MHWRKKNEMKQQTLNILRTWSARNLDESLYYNFARRIVRSARWTFCAFDILLTSIALDADDDVENISQGIDDRVYYNSELILKCDRFCGHQNSLAKTMRIFVSRGKLTTNIDAQSSHFSSFEFNKFLFNSTHFE